MEAKLLLPKRAIEPVVKAAVFKKFLRCITGLNFN
jgi:hypothetical protein